MVRVQHAFRRKLSIRAADIAVALDQLRERLAPDLHFLLPAPSNPVPAEPAGARIAVP